MVKGLVSKVSNAMFLMIDDLYWHSYNSLRRGQVEATFLCQQLECNNTGWQEATTESSSIAWVKITASLAPLIGAKSHAENNHSTSSHYDSSNVRKYYSLLILLFCLRLDLGKSISLPSMASPLYHNDTTRSETTKGKGLCTVSISLCMYWMYPFYILRIPTRTVL